jgi:glycosyltransferase involved in cell wall biosynthesis
VVADAATLLEKEPAQRRVRWRLVGQGPDTEELRSLVAERQLTTVSVEPPVAKHAVHDMLAIAHACLLHLRDSPVFRWGISPNKLFDYFAAARPVLMAVHTPHDPVATAGAGVSVAPGDPEALADGARRMAGLDHAALSAMGDAGHRYLLEHHDLDALAISLESVFEEIVPATTGGRVL